MKFTDGYWLLREGVTAAHPVEVLDVTSGPGSLEIHAPTQPIRHRGDLLKGPVVTITAHAPMPDVIGVTFTHFEGEEPRRPQFELSHDEFGTTHVSYDDDHAVLTSGALSVRVARTTPGTSTSSPTAAHSPPAAPRAWASCGTRPARTSCASS